MGQYIEIENKIINEISKSPTETDPDHSRSTKKWLLELDPDADKALWIAALAHDIERAYSTPEDEKKKEDFNNYRAIKTAHGRKSADIICELLAEYQLDDVFLKRVRFLVEHHEFGGDNGCDVLREADSISFFENNLKTYFRKYGPEKTKEKVQYMYERMSKRGREIVVKFQYENHELNNLMKDVLSQFE